MKRYLEQKELMASLFMAYFLYGKVKYGSRGHSETRLGKMSAYKSVMRLYLPLLLGKRRIPSDILLQRFAYLEEKAESLPEDMFKKVFLETIRELDPRHLGEHHDRWGHI